MRPVRVLYIEDDKNTCAATSRALKREGIAVRCVETLAEASALIRDSNDLDVVLLDINLPDSIGTETVQRIAAQTNIPIVCYSGAGDADSEIAASAKAAGAFEWLPKTADIRLVARMLRIAHARENGRVLLSAYVRGHTNQSR